MPRTYPPLYERFWSDVDVSRDCWLWLGSVSETGYGRMRPQPGTRERFVHRISYEMAHGPIPDGVVVRHSCDNPLCVRPTHLLGGSQADNVADRVARERGARGDRINTAKLSESDVIDIRTLHAFGAGCPQLAAAYGLDRHTTLRIVRRQTWRHVP